MSASVDPSERIEVSVMLRPRRSLDDLEARLSQPGAAVLSREEFAASYGADPADVAKVTAFASQHGLDVVESSPARRTIRLGGTAAQIAATFGVAFFADRTSDGATYRGYTGTVQIPPELEGIVQSVLGLDTHPVARRRSG